MGWIFVYYCLFPSLECETLQGRVWSALFTPAEPEQSLA